MHRWKRSVQKGKKKERKKKRDKDLFRSLNFNNAVSAKRRDNLDGFTCMYLWMCHEACLPSFTDSTVVFAKPAMSPPANTQGSLVCIVSVFTSGVPQRVSFTGAIASVTMQLQANSHCLPSVCYTLTNLKRLKFECWYVRVQILSILFSKL